VLDRRLGIPNQPGPCVYLEIGRRAGLRLEGVNFPGHFLVRSPAGPGDGRLDRRLPSTRERSSLKWDCRHLLRQHLGEEAAFEFTGLSRPPTRQHIVVRMLVNLKRLYVRMRSFPQARAIFRSAAGPSIHPALAELRDPRAALAVSTWKTSPRR